MKTVHLHSQSHPWWHLIFEVHYISKCLVCHLQYRRKTVCCAPKNCMAKISSLLLLLQFSISSWFLWWGLHIRTEQKRPAPTGFQALCCSTSSCGRDPTLHAPHPGWGHWVCIEVFRVGTFQSECILATQCQESMTRFLSWIVRFKRKYSESKVLHISTMVYLKFWCSDFLHP